MSTLQKAFDYQAIYNGLKLHFNKSYDYSKYGPLRRNQDPAKFEISPDRFVFVGFVKRFTTPEAFEEYLKLYGFRGGQIPYFRNFDDRDIDKEFNEVWMKIRYSFEYNLGIMLSELSLQDLKTNGTDYPAAYERMVEGKIYPSQFVVLDRTFNLMDQYAKIFDEDLYFQTKYEIYKKYRSVTQIPDLDKLKTLVKTTLRQT